MPSPKIIERSCLSCKSIFLARQTEINQGHAIYCCRGCRYKGQITEKLSKNCLNCNIVFHPKTSEVKQGNGKFCCRKCFAVFNTIPIEARNCLYCLKKFKTSHVQIKRGKGLFCSSNCSTASRNKGLAGTLEENFLKNIIKSETINACWIYKSSKTHRYGTVKAEGKKISAHRFSYEHYIGKIPAGMFVCHKCDIPKCVNPEHLFLGTPLENIQDMRNKKRENYPRGERQGHAKLTNDKVREIRKMIYRGIKIKQIALDFNVCQSAIARIKAGATWSHVI